MRPSLLLLLALTTAALAEAPRALFDGRSLAGWTGSPAWRVAGDTVTADLPAAGGGVLRWTGEAGDFELAAEFRLEGEPGARAALAFRTGGTGGYRVELDAGAVWLGRLTRETGGELLAERGDRVAIAPDGRRWSEAFGTAGDFAALLRPAPTWNTLRVVARGPHLEAWINGVRVAVADDHRSGAAAHHGSLALVAEAGPGQIEFRALHLTDLGRTPLPPAATAVAAAATELTTGANPGIGTTRRNGDPPLRRTPGVDDTTRLVASPVLWHLRGNPGPASAVANPAGQRVATGFRLVHGFQADLVAAEPDVRQPIAFAFDARGRIWIAEAHSYPNRQPEGQGRDRVIILEDADGDGHFETRRVFLEGLNLVSGLEVGFGGVWIGAAPHLLFVPDRDGDDRPDGPAEVMLDGWGWQDTHETLNSFTWGVDGWLYGCHGVFTFSAVGAPGTPAAQRQKIRAGVWRYHPVRRVFEVFAHGGSNQWGLDFNAHGHLFMTHCRSFHGGGGTTHVIRNGHYWNQANNDYAPWISNRAPDFAPGLRNFLPSSARYDSGEGGAGKPGTSAVYGGHSHVGTMIYLGDNWPAAYRDHLFTHNLHGHQINHQVNVRTGSGYETFHGGHDVLFSPDPTYLPVDLQYGPDGAVYAIDWSDTQHCHNPRDEIWDRTNGRVYRVAWAATWRPARVDLGRMDDAALAALHGHPSEWHVRTARRILQERAARGALAPAALADLRARADDRAAPITRQLRALWTLHATGTLDAARLAAALAHPDDVVRAWAVQLATEDPGRPALPAEQFAGLAATESSAHVRLALASAVPALPAEARWTVAAALAGRADDAADRFLPRLVWSALAPEVAADLPRALALARETPLPVVADSLRWFAARQPAGREALVAEVAAGGPVRTLRLLAFALEAEAGLPMPAAWPRLAARFAGTADPHARDAVEQLAALFGDRSVLGPVRARLADRNVPVAERRRALDLLRRAGDPGAVPLLAELLGDIDLRAAVIPLVGAAPDATAAAQALLGAFRGFGPAERNAALAVLTGRAELARALLGAVAAGTFDRRDLTALHARQLRKLGDAEVNRLLEQVWGRAAEASTDAKATIARLRDTFRNAPVWAFDAAAGRRTYERLCAACHVSGGPDAGRLGPDLAGTWRNGLDYFLENIVDPNAVVGAAYELHVLTRRDGTVVSGMIDRESDTAVVVRTVAETVTIPRADIRERQRTTQSLMPPGLLEALPEREAVELLKYLTEPR
jgi:putative membrane-bound dehydrogenase-like protein